MSVNDESTFKLDGTTDSVSAFWQVPRRTCCLPAGLRTITANIVACCVFFVCPGLSSQAGETQARFFDQLRARQLFPLAERYCLEKLARTELPPAQRIDFAYELSRTFVQHALVAADDQQAELWDRSLKVLDEAGQQVGQHDKRVLLELQTGFVACARGHALRWQVDLVPDDAQVRQRAIQFLATGIERLMRLESDLKVRVRKPPPKDVAPQDKFTPAEIRSLLLMADYELGQAQFETANLLAADNPDRLATIEQAERWLGAALNADRNGDTGLSSQVLLAGCARLRIEAPRALRLLDETLADNPSPAIIDLATAERARIHLIQKKPVEAAELLTKALKNRPTPPGELVGLRIQVLIELAQAADDKQSTALSKELQDTIDHQLERVRTTNPGYWAAYCETLVTQFRESKSLGTDLAEKVRAARGLYSAKQIPSAIAAYADAGKLALDTGRSDVAFDLGYTQGSIEIESGRFAEAVQTFDRIVASAPQQPRAADAHLLAAYALGKIYASDATKANREAYTAKLLRQRQDYPDHATSGEATWLLGQLEEKRLQNSAAIQLYLEIPPAHARGPAAAAAAARCYDQLLARLREIKQPTDKWETEAIERLSGLLPKNQAAKTLSVEQAVVALYLSNIVLQSASPDFVAADQWLEWVTRSASSTSPAKNATEAADLAGQWQELQRAAARLRVVSLAGQEKFTEAEQMLATVGATSPTELLSIIDGLSKLVSQAQEKPRHHLGELQLRVVLNLKSQRPELSPTDQQRLDRCVAEAYVAAGKYSQAIQPYKDLIKSRPTDASVQTGYAQLLLKFGQREKTEEAQAVWKKLETHFKSGSAGWFEARYQVARCEVLLGNPDKAKKLISVTRVLFPKLGGLEMEKKFKALEEASR